MDPHLLRTFVCVAELGSFSAAAHRSGSTLPRRLRPLADFWPEGARVSLRAENLLLNLLRQAG